MRDGAGGYQRPGAGQPPAGPGAGSTRTDGNQPVVPADLDRSDMKHGDVDRLKRAVQAVPIGNAPPIPAGGGGNGPVPAPPAPTQSLTELRGQGLPDGFFDQPSARDNEPGTAGLDMGAGPGSEMLANPAQPPDQRSAILNYVAGLAEQYSSSDAARILNSITTGQEAQGVTMMGADERGRLPVPEGERSGLPEEEGLGAGEPSEDEFASEEFLSDDDLDAGLGGDLDLDAEGDLLGDFAPEESAPEDISEGDDFDEGEEELASDYETEGPSETEDEELEEAPNEAAAEEGEGEAEEESEEGEGEKPRRRRRKSGGEGE